MADLRAELAALKQRVDDVEREGRANFGTVGVAIRKTRQQLVEVETRQSVERLRPPSSLIGWTPRQGTPADPAIEDSLIDRLRKGEQVSGTLGNTEPVIGQTNLLRNPLLSGLGSEVVTNAPAQVLPDWSAHYVLNSGTAPSIACRLWYDRLEPDSNPFNSAFIELIAFGSANTYNLDLYFYPTVELNSDSGVSPLPFLVGSGRVTTLGDTPGSSFATARARIELYDDDANSVVGFSEWVDYADLIGLEVFSLYPIRQLVAAAVPARNRYFWQLRINLVKTTAAAQSISTFVGEPLLHFAYSPDPIPYAPLIGQWVPDILSARTGTETFERARLDLDGLTLGSGTAAGDVRLDRISAGILGIADPTGANPGILVIEGAGADEGGELQLWGAAANADWSLDNYQGAVRFHSAGTVRADLTTARLKLTPGSLVLGSVGVEDIRIFRNAAKVIDIDDGAGGNLNQAIIRANLSNFLGSIFVNSTQVVAGRKTGWTVPTGTAQRGTFATDTVTLINLARAVKALIDDLHSTAGHGLIGT